MVSVTSLYLLHICIPVSPISCEACSLLNDCIGRGVCSQGFSLRQCFSSALVSFYEHTHVVQEEALLNRLKPGNKVFCTKNMLLIYVCDYSIIILLFSKPNHTHRILKLNSSHFQCFCLMRQNIALFLPHKALILKIFRIFLEKFLFN